MWRDYDIGVLVINVIFYFKTHGGPQADVLHQKDVLKVNMGYYQ